MFDQQASGADGGGGGRDAGGDEGTHVGAAWREIDRQVRRLARRRATLDADEARLLVAAKAAGVHRHLGYGSFDEYLERVLGYAPTTGRDRMRVATALVALPEIARALTAGTVTFSAVRELTRVATADTETAWLDAIDGLTAREIEHCVRGRKPGDHPDQRPDPQLEPRAVRLQLLPEAYALFLEARRKLEAEVGQAMTDSEFMAVACRGVLGGDGAAADNTPPHQIALTVCVDCKRGWQDAVGRPIEVSPAAIESARCDAIELDRVDGAAPALAQRTIPAAVRRMVLARDHHRCTIPGCASSRFVDVHHVRHRADGGDNQPMNLACLCSSHHLLLHHGTIRIDGVPGALRVTHADGRPYGAPPPPEPPAPAPAPASASAPPPPPARASAPAPAPAAPAPARASSAQVIADARTALVTLGFRPHEAQAAVARAVAHMGDVALDVLLPAALRATSQLAPARSPRRS